MSRIYGLVARVTLFISISCVLIPAIAAVCVVIAIGVRDTYWNKK